MRQKLAHPPTLVAPVSGRENPFDKDVRIAKVRAPMMKSNPVGSILAGVLVLAVAATSILIFNYLVSVRKLQRLQAEVAMINRNQAALQSLAAEASEYSRRNPAIDPILQSVGVKSKASPNLPQPKSNTR